MIDFNRFSLDTLLKMAHDVSLIEDYQKFDDHAMIVVGTREHVVSHRLAREFLSDLLADWWKRQQETERVTGN